MKNRPASVCFSAAICCLLTLFLSLSAVHSFAFGLSVDGYGSEALAQRLADGIAEMPALPDKSEDGTVPSRDVQVCSTNLYPSRKGIILVTDVKVSGIVPTGHAAIVYNGTYCVESVAEGVVLGKNNWNTQYQNCAAAAVEGTTFAQDEAVGNWCYRQIGKPYNWSYYNISRRDAFYCAQLVWAGYNDLCGIDLNTSEAGAAIHPLELLWSPNTYKVYGKGSLA